MNKSGKQYQKVKQEIAALSDRIKTGTSVMPVSETQTQKEKRIERYFKGDFKGFEMFCNYYFPHYVESEFGWFHKEAYKGFSSGGKNYKGVWEFPRGHAKSVLLVMLSLWDKAKGHYLKDKSIFRGLVLASQTEDMACELLASWQIELKDNARYNADYGQQYLYGDWADGAFKTADGVGFWGFGLGQNPVGLRKQEKRPTHIFVDDADSKKRAENPDTVEKDYDWINGELAGTQDIKHGCKLVYVNNRVHKRGLTAKMVGDVEPGDAKRKEIHHIKVFLTENKKTRERLDINAGGEPAWIERYTVEDCEAAISLMAENAERQLYHNHVEKGKKFKEENMPWGAVPKDSELHVVTYADLSFKDHADMKGVVKVGLKGRTYYILKVFLRHSSKKGAVNAHLDMVESSDDEARHYFEANFIQDTHKDTYDEVAEERRMDNIVRMDTDRKDNKVTRVESLEPLFENGCVIFNEEERDNMDMLRLREQFIGFPGHRYDDGPDAVHGAIAKLRYIRKGNMKGGSNGIAKTGKYKYNTKRKMH